MIGLFIDEVMVAWTGHFSGWGGGGDLAMIAVPVVVCTTEDI